MKNDTIPGNRQEENAAVEMKGAAGNCLWDDQITG